LDIEPKYWNKETQTAKQTEKFKEHPEFNRRLRNLKASINNAFIRYQNDNSGEIPTKTTLKNLLDIELERVEVTNYTFFSYFQKYIDNLKNKSNVKTGKSISKSTIGIYTNTKNIVEEFQNTYRRRISFETIDMDFYHDLIEHLTTTKTHSTNTIGKIIKNIKVVLNDATETGINKNLTFKSKRFIAPAEKSFSIYMNESELTEINNIDLSEHKKLDVVRDLFLIGCYTGLRYSDYTNIKPKNIDIKNNLLEIKTQKTGTTVAIPLHRTVKAILKKYNNELPKSISNQKTNDYLKELGKRETEFPKDKKTKCLHETVTKVITKGGMEKHTNMKKYDLLSTHTARRSFATNLFLSGFPAISIMKITGHTTEKSFMKYIKITPTENAKLLQLHWDKERRHNNTS
jgi:integrase